MANQNSSDLFRKEALEQVSSPEQLDQLIQLVHLKTWLPLGAIGLLLAVALGWGIFGRIPIYVEAKGILLPASPISPTSPIPPTSPISPSPAPNLLGIAYFPVADSGQVQPGAPALIIPNSTSFQEVGALKATVTRVSPTPVTKAALLNRIQNNQELADLVYTPAAIEVITQLQPAPTPSGYQWTVGQGPSQPLAAQTPATVRIQLSQQAPLSLLLPQFKR
ncbi:MAG: hypothetical protein ACKO7W_02300 [Elainella sp.]